MAETVMTVGASERASAPSALRRRPAAARISAQADAAAADHRSNTTIPSLPNASDYEWQRHVCRCWFRQRGDLAIRSSVASASSPTPTNFVPDVSDSVHGASLWHGLWVWHLADVFDEAG